jgi:hypothetical protein
MFRGRQVPTFVYIAVESATDISSLFLSDTRSNIGRFSTWGIFRQKFLNFSRKGNSIF